MSPGRPILVVGVPRSGTSWVGRVLGSTPGTSYVGEPDNHEHSAFALRAKRRISRGFYPALAPEDEAPEYERIWRAAFEGPTARELGWWRNARGRVAARLLRDGTPQDMLRAFRGPRAPGTLWLADLLAVPDPPEDVRGAIVVKSVHAQLALEWIHARSPISVVVVLRNPLAVISSWKELGWLESQRGFDVLDELDPTTSRALADAYAVPLPGPGASTLLRACWLVGVLTSALVDALDRHPEWRAVQHEDLLLDPHGRHRALAERLGLPWNDAVDRLLDDMNRPGRGYETERVLDGLADVWRSRLSAAEISAARSVFDAFPALARPGGVAPA